MRQLHHGAAVPAKPARVQGMRRPLHTTSLQERDVQPHEPSALHGAEQPWVNCPQRALACMPPNSINLTAGTLPPPPMLLQYGSEHGVCEGGSCWVGADVTYALQQARSELKQALHDYNWMDSTGGNSVMDNSYDVQAVLSASKAAILQLSVQQARSSLPCATCPHMHGCTVPTFTWQGRSGSTLLPPLRHPGQ